ncbi:hypothetical protein A2316_01090 [Candidatus Falkowbacteria bacterium RIFOXYB2_FULL_38_15]|uniref:Pyruvate ferredoxin oxidoreductase n=1 Tax=Candidatus Falkowbacteria bacterium RIFOXYA2_FULL_38_12 TaxID=1797993 RepID=A0A1F5S508_9BACT|nr:MAG: hypothetical protein A2257_02495 [Candidatus Falkowbacteria bacterium RIFOXYA2_FULL_38_12]OGF32782.1 MAG: hypothetical protein A2316_01090 [Candidatus Falkowbacteria bacterium RIFOXYB2_FULL_38_15]OGF42182.1 MAG: hypothetical protein A2555_02805 [Candidatus Falkowbacteria bacterium RIFOXYD2_FULL_39_16]
MIKFQEGSETIAETIRLCRPKVIAAYPITPQTHIVESLARSNTKDFEYILAESEMSAASIVLGASATGVRTYTATSSQGLLLMTEVLFDIAGLRLPVVMTCANRAVSAPINIWNDEQDIMTIRDAGWIILFAESNQQAADLHIQAYKIAEKISLPVAVCVDGFALTHTFEAVELRDQKMIDKFLPKYQPKKESFLDPENPVTLGGLCTPATYMPIRKNMHQDLLTSKKIIKETFLKFNNLFSVKKIFGDCKISDGLIEYSGPNNPELVFIASGSVLGTIKSTYDYNLRQKNKIGVLNIKSLRPFPDKEIINFISKIKPKNIAVIDRSISLGQTGILFSEIKTACYGKAGVKIKNFIMGLGGKNITPKDIQNIVINFKSKSEFQFVL